MSSLTLSRNHKIIKKRKTKGFILAELIIVLVILALLVAILLPLIIHYIDSAKEDAEISETRAVKVAIQTIIIHNEADGDINKMIKYINHDNLGLSKTGKNRVEELLEMEIGRTENIKINNNNVLVQFDYFTINGSKIVFNNGKYKVKYIY